MLDLKLKTKPLYTAATAVYPYSKDMETHFIVKTKYEPDPIFLTKKMGDFLLVPRELAPLGEDRRSRGTPIAITCTMDFKPDTYEVQKQLHGDSLALLKQGVSHTLNALMGLGKSYIATRLICDMGLTTLIIVTKEDLMQQWKDNLLKYTKIKEEEIGFIQQDVCQVEGKKVVIGLVHSLAGRDYPSSIYSAFGLTVADECFHPDHELLTPSGWVSIADLPEDAQVMSFDAHTDTMRFEPILRKVVKPFSGNLIAIAGRGFHTVTTPNHEQPIKREKAHGWSVCRIPVADLLLKSRIKLPIAGYVSGDDGRRITDWERLLIAFEADGHHLYTSKNSGIHTYRFSFRRPRKISRLKSILSGCGIDHSVSVNCRGDTSITFKHTSLLPKNFDWFDPYVSSPLNADFLEELTHWDGWSNDEGCFFEHLLESTANTIVIIAKLCGRAASIIKTGYSGREKRYRVRWFADKPWISPKGYTKTMVPYSGDVHCVTVPSGNVLTRYKGSLSISGNCHRMSAETFSQAMFKFNSYLRLGLSATPVRPDGKSFIFRAHIGEVGSSSDHVQLAPRVLVIRTNWKLPLWRVRDDFGGYKMIPMPLQRGRPAVVSSKMAKDPERNHLLADLCLKAYKKDRRIVMFFDSLAHIEVIKKLLISMGIPKTEILRYTGGISKTDAATAHSMRVLLATYSYMSEGTDVPFLDTAILCSPRSNVSQTVGRILRKVPGKKEPVIMDILDSCAQELLDSFQSRVRQYKKLNATIVDIT